MDLLRQYGGATESSDSEDEGAQATLAKLRQQTAHSAPAVDTSALTLVDGEPLPSASQRFAPAIGQHMVYWNPTADELAQPRAAGDTTDTSRNHRNGLVEDYALNSVIFDTEYAAFNTHAVAASPSGTGRLVGDVAGAAAAAALAGGANRRKSPEDAAKEAESGERAKRARAARRADVAATNPEAAWRLKTVQPWAAHEATVGELTEEQKTYLAEVAAAKKAGGGDKAAEQAPQAFFHGKADKDWQGRSWMAPPKDKRKELNEKCFLPKRWIHTWSGHTKGVNAIRFFPTSGHLLLSAGLDSKVKIWDVHGSGKCLQTYHGHSQGVRDVTFTADGTKFLSTAYDKQVHLWDTETGQVVRTLKLDTMGYCLRLHPHADKENTLMVGTANKKIYQFDLDSGEMVQQYDYHLGAVNTITFIDDGKKFVSTSDDKTIRVWELGIPVQVKYIADPAMHSMPAVGVHPNGKYLAFQSLDNQIVSYNCKDKFKLDRKKNFKGHNSSGNACQVNFSPDGRFIMSGDSTGKLYFWEWTQPARIVRTIPAHEKTPCIGCEWHPLETSKVATCGWDGLIKYWD